MVTMYLTSQQLTAKNYLFSNTTARSLSLHSSLSFMSFISSAARSSVKNTEAKDSFVELVPTRLARLAGWQAAGTQVRYFALIIRTNTPSQIKLACYSMNVNSRLYAALTSSNSSAIIARLRLRLRWSICARSGCVRRAAFR